MLASDVPGENFINRRNQQHELKFDIIHIYCRNLTRFISAHIIVGEWLSLVEHLVRDQGVGGSNPLSPTNIFNNLRLVFDCSILPL